MSAQAVVFGKYQLLERLARGGMAEVYKAKAHGVEGFEKILVIKRILPHLSNNQRFVELFINEAKVAVTLSHANIVQVFDLGQVDGSYFIAMEYVAGSDLSTLLGRTNTLSPGLAMYVVSEVAKALDYAHRRRDAQRQPLQIVHRDVSPQNILTSTEGEVKLADFGIARARIGLQREDGSLRGKFAYMSPEQARGGPIDARSDLFSLGAVLYECVSGTKAFGAQSADEILRRVRQVDYEPLNDVLPPEHQPLSAIIDKALAADPNDRFQDAGQMYEAIVEHMYADGRHVGARTLADHITKVMGPSKRVRRTTGIRRALLDDSLVHTGTDKTPVEVPKSSRSQSSSVRAARIGDRPQAERRDLTVLALGPHGAPSLPKDVLAPMQRFSARLVNDMSTSGWWYLVFGLDAPDGRDTETAVRFFLLLRRIMLTGTGSLPSFQVGIHCGRAIVDADGQLVRDEHYAQLLGQATQSAELAQPGQVLLTAEAERAARRAFELRRVPGADRWAVAHERSAKDTRGRFVGRREQLKRFGQLLAEAGRGTAHTIAIVGEPGSGKTRTLLELQRRLRLGGHEVGTYVARLHPQSSRVPMGACLDMLRVVLGMDPLDPPVVVKHKARRLRELGLAEPQRRAVESLLGLDVEIDEAQQSLDLPTGDAILQVTRRLAQDRLTIFAFDGVDAADPESLSLIRSLLSRPRSSHVLVVITHRPGGFTEWESLPGYEKLVLVPFDRATTKALVCARLGTQNVPAQLLDEIEDKSRGNPLYIEEHVRALQDAGAIEPGVDGQLVFVPEVADVQVPKTLRGMMAARLSRLTPRTKNLIQVAAVVGQRFSLDLLAKITGREPNVVRDTLTELQHHGLVQTESYDEFALANQMIGEVIVDGLTLEARRHLHLATATAIEALYPSRLDEFAERLAHHHRDAGDRKKSVHYLVRAAGRLEADYAFGGALTHLESALDATALEADPDRTQRLELYLRLGQLCLRSRQWDRGAARMIAGLDLADGLGRDDFAARFCMLRGQLLSHSERIDESRDWLQRARNTARRQGHPSLIRDVMIASAQVEIRNGNFAGAVQPLEEAYEASVRSGDNAAQLKSLMSLGIARAGNADRKGALQAIANARTVAGPQADQVTICELFEAEAQTHYYLRNRQEAIESSEHALQIAKEHGFNHSMVVNAYYAGECYLRLRMFKQAFARIRYSLDLAEQFGMSRMVHINRRTLGFLDVLRTETSESRQSIVEACEFAARNGHVGDLIQGTFMLAYADHTLERSRDALEGFRETMRLAQASGHKLYETASRKALDALAVGHPVELPD